MLIRQIPVLISLESFVLGNTRKIRRVEADKLGIVMAAKAGFEPRAAANIRGKLGAVPEKLVADLSPVSLFSYAVSRFLLILPEC
jgi:hypothetical protein